MPDAWYTFLSTVLARVYFARILVIGAERLPKSGPTLYGGLHRNGAVDGFVYKSIFKRAIFLIAAQLQKNFFSRMFFTGIPIIRDKDSGDRGMNAAAMESCGKLLASGGELFIFPEGTSSMGPKHLPFKSGAARIAVEAWQHGVPLKVVPLGITYDAPSRFRSSVEVIVGEPIGAEQIARLPDAEQLDEAKNAITRALENVGINVESAEYFEELRLFGSIASARGNYFHAMKLAEKGMPLKLQAPWAALPDQLQGRSVKRSDAANTFSSTPSWLALIAGILLSMPVSLGAILNFLPLYGAYWAGRKFPDAPNVITLWRVLTGAPLFVLWFVAIFTGLAAAGRGAWFIVFLFPTVLGWLAYQPARRLLVAGWNGIRFSTLRREYLGFQKLLFEELRNHGF